MVGHVNPDWSLSPYTGWTRDHWVNLAETLLASARANGTPNHARIHFPGAPGGYGHDVDGLEGFARTLLAAGFLAAGDPDRRQPLEWYAPGFATGPDPTLDPSLRWVRPSEHDQAKVEACSLALILHLTRPYLWDTFESRTQELVVDYLAEWIHGSYPKNNWVWFRLTVEQFLRSVGGPWSPDDIEEDLAFNESCYVGSGWYSDGVGRTFDYYNGWVFHVYPLLWCDMLPDDPQTQALRPIFQERLNAYLRDAANLIGSDGAMMAQGRSLIYRFAQASALWMGAYTDSPSLTPGQIRRATSGMVKSFADHGVPSTDGILPMGWYGPWRHLAQSYSGPGSPYWACKGLLGLTLPATHPVWTDIEEPLPIDIGDPVTAIPVPGWIMTGSSGIARILNHGTDHAQAGENRADSPLYARFGYSTATFPLLDENAWITPIEQSVCLIDQQGRASHRTGFAPLGVSVGDGPNPVGIACSVANAHWVDPSPAQVHHGSGYVGDSEPAGQILTVSLVRGPWEVRAVHVDQSSATKLRIGGWAVSGQQIMSSTSEDTPMGVATAVTDDLRSDIRAVTGLSQGGVEFHENASPLGTPSAVPYLDMAVPKNSWVISLVTLDKPPETASGVPTRVAARIYPDDAGIRIHVSWPDAVDTESLVRLDMTGATPSSPDIHTAPEGVALKGDTQ